MSRDPKSAYYDAGGIETLEVIKAKLTPEQYRGYLLGNAIKYACRLNFKGCAERDAEKLAVYSKELAASTYKQRGKCMTVQRYELLDLTSADGPRAMVTEYEEGTYVLHTDHVAEVAALKTRIAELEEELAAIARKQGVGVSFEGDWFDGGKCGNGGFCDKCPLLKD